MRYFIGAGALAAVAVGAYFTVGTDRTVADALAPEACPPVSIDFDFGKGYEGPLIDTHMHVPHPPEHSLDRGSGRPTLGVTFSLGRYRCVFSQEGIIKAFAFFPVFPGLEEQHLAVVKGASEQYADVFVPFIMPPDDDGSPDGFPTVSADVLEEMLSVYPDIFRGYGEIGLYARGDHGGPKGAPELPPDSERLRAIYPIVRANKLVVYFHLGEGQQDAIERAASANPDIIFIFHGDQLISTDNGKQDLSVIDGILSRHPNVRYGVDELYGDVWLLHPEKTKKAFMAHFENYEELLEKDVATWKAFIERHPDQVLWGTDRGVGNLWSMDPEVGLVLSEYARAFINRLDPSVREKYAHKNAERLLSAYAE